MRQTTDLLLGLIVAVSVALLVFWLTDAAHAQSASAQPRDLTALKRAVDTELSSAASLQAAAMQQLKENVRIAQSLGTVVSQPPPPTLEALRQAQFEVDISRTRLLNLENSQRARLSQIADLNSTIVRLSTQLRGERNDTLRAVVDEAALALHEAQKAAAEAVSAQIDALRSATDDAMSWQEEKLAITQAAASLDVLVSGNRTAPAAQVAYLRDIVQDLAQQALAVGSQASAITETNQPAIIARNALRVRADELTLRSNARLTDVAIVQARDLLDGLRPLIPEQSVPVRIFDDAIKAIDVRGDALKGRLAVNATIRSALHDLADILRDDVDRASSTLNGRMDRLRALLDTQEREIGTLNDEITTTREELTRERSLRERRRLFVRETARTDRQGRQRFAAELKEIPSELQALYIARLTEVRAALSVASSQSIGVFVALALITMAIVFWLKQRVLRRFTETKAKRATQIPMEVVRRNLFWLLPVAIWTIFTQIFAISGETAASIQALLIIPAASASLVDLTSVIVARRGAQSSLGRIITRTTTVAMMLTAAVVFGFLVLDELPLLPSTQSALNRLAYSVFVLAGLPMLLFVIFFAQGGEGDDRSRAYRAVGALLALLPPAALIATGLTGLAGYKHLAAIMLEDLAIAIAIATSLSLCLGVLHDLASAIAGRIRDRDPARAYFMRQNFIEPGERVLQVAMILIAVATAARVFRWASDTIIIRDLFATWRTAVFTASGATYSLGDAIVAIGAFFLVFWAAAWFRRIAYSVLLQRVKDIGIRQSLSVFAQYVVIVLGTLVTLSAVGFDITTLTVFAASLGVGIGFGLQNVVNNFISGVLLLVERPLRLGDIVTVGTASGTVSQIGIRSMRLRTFDEFDLIVPNSALVSDTFTNWTRSNTVMRVLLTVGISYNDDPRRAVAIVETILDEHTGVVTSPAPMVTVDEFGASSIDLRVCYYIDLRGSQSGFRIRGEVLTAIKVEFDRVGLSIPFPQRDIHVMAPPADQPMVLPEIDARPAPRQRPDDDWIADAVEMVDDD